MAKQNSGNPFMDLIKTLIDSNKKANDSSDAHLKEQKETNRLQKEIVNVLKDIQVAFTGKVEKPGVPGKVDTVKKILTDEPQKVKVASGVSDLRVISKNTSALLMMSRDINVIRQNMVHLGKHLGAKTVTKADAMFRKEGVLREKADVEAGKVAEQNPESQQDTGFLGKMKAVGSGLGNTAKSLLAMAAALFIAAKAFQEFATVKWESIGKGVVAIAALAGAVKLAGSGDAHKSILALGAGTLALAFGLNMFADVSWESVAKGALVMLTLGAAAKMAGENWKSIAAIAASMVVLSYAFEKFAAISWGDFAKGVLAMASLVVVTNLASGSLVGGGAMLLLAGAIWVISEAFQNFAEISWGDVIKGIATIAVLAIGAAALAALALPIVITAGALTLLGLSLMALGGGLTMIGSGLENMTSGLQEITKIDGDNLMKVAAGIGAISFALLAFGAAQMATALANLVTNFLSFGQDSPVEQLEKIGKAGDGIQKAADGLNKLADAMKNFADVDADNLENLMDALDEFPWDKATKYAKSGGVFNVSNGKMTATVGSGTAAPVAANDSRVKGTTPAAQSDKVVPLTKAPITSGVNYEEFTLAGEPVTKDKPLTKQQKAVMKQAMASGNTYPDWVMRKYKSEGDELAAKSSDLETAKRGPAAGQQNTSIVNAPVTNVSQTTNNPGTKDPRNYQPSYNNYLNRRLAN